MTRAPRRAAPVAVVVLLAVALAPAPARADTAGDLARARADATSVETSARTLAGRLEAATVAHARATDELTQLRARVDATQRRLRELRAILRDLAVAAYTGGSAPGLTAVLDADDVVDAGRRSHILGAATEPQDRAVDEFERLRRDLAGDERALDDTARQAAEQLQLLQSQGDALQTQLAAAQAARDRLAVELAREEEARAASAWLTALERAAATPVTVPSPRVPGAAPTTTTTRPQAAPDRSADPAPPAPGPERAPAFPCPIDGAVAFVDSWGAPRSGGRSHEGVDMMAAAGTPNVAVVSGEITHKEGSLAGLGVYLAGDDGNEYWYFHLDAYEGAPRRVTANEVVGYTGATGNAGSPHTHFEYHPAGGAARNPYPLVRDAC